MWLCSIGSSMGMPIDMFFSYIYIHSQYYSIEKTIHDIYIYKHGMYFFCGYNGMFIGSWPLRYVFSVFECLDQPLVLFENAGYPPQQQFEWGKCYKSNFNRFQGLSCYRNVEQNIKKRSNKFMEVQPFVFGGRLTRGLSHEIFPQKIS